MWTAETRALVGDFGAGQALSDEQYALLVPLIPYHPSVPPDAPERWQRDQELKETLDASQAALEEGGPAAGRLPRPLPRGFFSAGRG